MIDSSLSSAEGSSNFQVVSDVSVLGSGGERHVSLGSVLSHHLHVDVAQVVVGERLTLTLVQQFGSFFHYLLDAVRHLLSVGLFILVVDSSQELVVFFINVELEGVLVVCEQCVVSVSQVGQGSSEIEGVFDGRSVVHGSEVVFLDGEYHELL